MTPRAPRLPATIQLNLPLLQAAGVRGAGGQTGELTRALVELLIGAAHVDPEDGGDDESEAHR